MKISQKQTGFTLIELVVVIVILGILAATAAPKFINISGDARASVMEGVRGSMNSAMDMIHAKALIAGETDGTGEVVVNGVFYALVNGYPAAAAAGDGTATANNGLGIEGLLEIDDSDITFSADSGEAVVSHGGASDSDTCQLTYIEAEKSSERPVIDTSKLSGEGCS